MKRNQKISVIVASILLSNSIASAAIIERRADQLATTTADLTAILINSDSKTVDELKLGYNQILKMSQTLQEIQNSNNQDSFLKIANMIQVILIGSTTYFLKSHLGKTESLPTAKNYSLQLAAASSIISILTRYYIKIKNLEPENISIELQKFNEEILKQNVTMTPEISDMLSNINSISLKLIDNKSQIENSIKNLTGNSNFASCAIILMAIAQYISPKLQGETQSLFKKYGSELVKKGSNVAGSSGAIKLTGGYNGISDLIGIAMGLNGENSQNMISATVLNLNSVLIQLKAQIDQTAK